MKALLALLISLIVLPTVLAASLDISLPPILIKDDPTAAQITVNSDTIFNGRISFYYENLQSEISAIDFDTGDFEGSGPYKVKENLQLIGKNIGNYKLSAALSFDNGTTISIQNINGYVNSSAPIILSISPIGVVTKSVATLQVTTNENAICKYTTSNSSDFDNASTAFTETGTKIHTQILSALSQTSYNYYVRCKDFQGNIMLESKKISFIVDLPPTAEISLDDTSPVAEGVIEVTVITSESLDIPPRLQYSFSDAPESKTIISLKGSSSYWKGYMIITEDDDNKVGTFHFLGTDNRGTVGELITEGNIFLVDTSKPPAPLNVETIEKNGIIRIKWYYEGEPVETFNVYRSVSSGVDYIDFYAATDNTSFFTDSSVNDKVTYYYKIAAIDEAGNVGKLSDEVYATSIKDSTKETTSKETTKTEEPKVLPPNLVLLVDDYKKIVEQLEIDIKDLTTNLENIGGEEKELITELGLIEDAKEAKSKLTQIKASLEELKKNYRTQEGLESELNTYDLEMKKIKKTLVKELKIIEKGEYIQTITKEDTKNLVEKLFTEYTDKEKSDYVKKNTQIQKDISIEVVVKVVQFEYLDLSTKEQTLITKRISYLNPETIKDIIVTETVPPTIVKDIDEITFKQNYEKLEINTAKFGILELNFEGKTLNYEIDKVIDVQDTKKISTVVLVGPVELEKSTDVTGFSIFSFFTDSGMGLKEKLGIWIGIALIAILAGYYLIFVKGINIKQISLPKKKEKIRNDIPDNFPKIKKIDKIQDKEIERIEKQKLENIKDLLNLCQEFISQDDFDKAALIYPKVQVMYRNLPKPYRSQVFKECLDIQKTIKEGQKNLFDSLL